MKRGAAAMAALSVCIAAAAADELSGADKLRVVYSNQFAWTRDGLPIVTVRVMEHRSEVTIASAGVRLQPDGEGGAEIQGGASWTVRLRDARPGKLRWHVVVARLPPASEALKSELGRWRDRGLPPRSFEVGALFAIKGEVLDSRRALVTVAPSDSQAEAQRRAAELHTRFNVATSLHPESIERPSGTLEASSERGTVVRNQDILWFTPAPGGLLELRDVDKEGGGRESRRYFGKLYVTVDDAGQLAVVNAVPEDKLLAGLLPAEIGAGAPPEALKAQAVAARNQLLAKIGTRHLTEPYRLCSTTHCQVYAGAGREDPRATAAVTATRGELLVRDDGGDLVDTVYSASCGGHGEDNERAWGGSADASLRGKLDGDDGVLAALGRFARVAEADLRDFLSLQAGNHPDQPWCARPAEALANFRWHKSLDLTAVAARAGVGRLRAIDVLERGVSGRATRLRLSGDGGEKEVRGELEIRRALGNLKSALFVLDVARDASGYLASVEAVGGGHGHGIGMCQTGAIAMGLAGKSYVEILRHYFSATHLRKLY
jgi:SpoIID/LytB domain protein